MTSALTIVLLGFLLGMRHASDPDHVVAVTTIVRRERAMFQAMLVGAFWGLGHTITILVIGSALILFKLTIPPRLGLSMELSVAIMLILLGTMTLSGVTQHAIERMTTQPNKPHSDVGQECFLIHTHPSQSFLGPAATAGLPARGRSNLGWFHVLRPLAVGVVHGLAGSAAVALLVLATINNPFYAIGFLLVFGLGTVAGMMLITGVIAVPFAFTFRRFAGMHRGLSLASGLVSVFFGLFLFYQIAIVNRLFAAHPNWIPH